LQATERSADVCVDYANPHDSALQSYGAGPLATLVLEQSRQVASKRERGSNLFAAFFLVEAALTLHMTEIQGRGGA
jgi:hypothetical protein